MGDPSAATAARAEKYAKHRDQERARQRAYYQENIEKRRAKARAYQASRRPETQAAKNEWAKKARRRDPVRFLIQGARARAKQAGMEFDISVDDIYIPEFCPVFGTRIYPSGEQGRMSAPSIDRIDNFKGYIKGNVRVISLRANIFKRDMTREECELLLKNWSAR